MKILCREEDRERVADWFWPWLANADEKYWMLATMEECHDLDMTQDIDLRIQNLEKEGATQAMKRIFCGDQWYKYAA